MAAPSKSRKRALASVLFAAALMAALAGCTQPPAPALVLTHTPITYLFPDTKTYSSIEPSVDWIANLPSDQHLSKRELRLINDGTETPSKPQFGAACSQLLRHPPSVTWREIAQQSVSYGKTVELVSIMRAPSVQSAERSQAARIEQVDVCSSSQGSSVFNPVNAQVPGSAAFVVDDSITGESDFVAYGRVAQFQIEVTGVYADAATIGAKTFKVVMSHVNDLARGVAKPTRPVAPTPVFHPQPLQIPLAKPGDLARLRTGPEVDFVGTGLTLPPSPSGYSVEWACTATDPNAKAGWELDDAAAGGTMIASSSSACDGSDQLDADASLTRGYSSVHFYLTGDYDSVQMYAILSPTPTVGG